MDNIDSQRNSMYISEYYKVAIVVSFNFIPDRV